MIDETKARRFLYNRLFSKTFSGFPNEAVSIDDKMMVFTFMALPGAYTWCPVKLLREMIEKSPIPPGDERIAWAKTIVICFKKLDSDPSFLPRSVNDWMDTAWAMWMDMMNKVNTFRLKKAFVKWAFDEELLGPTHADGGAAKKRALDSYDENVLDALRARPGPTP